MKHETNKYSFKRHAWTFWVGLVSIVFAGCAPERSLVHFLPDGVQDEIISVITRESTASLVTVIYSPEWEDLNIIERRLVEGKLRCVAYLDIPHHKIDSLHGETWYETSNQDDIADFLRIRDQLISSADVTSHPQTYSSNPTQRMFLFDGSGNGVLLTDPWGRRGAHWFAEQTILFNAALDDGETGGDRVRVRDWVDPPDAARWDLINMRYQFIPAETFYASVFLDFFDLQQRLKWKFEQDDASHTE